MNILINGVKMHLSPDTEIPLTLMSPILNDEGSYGVGVSLPGTTNNLAAIGYPNSDSHTSRPIVEAECTIQLGVISLQGKSTIISASREGIEMDVILQEGSFYDDLDQIQLSDIVTKTVHFPSVDQSVDCFVKLEESVTTDNGEYTAFEVCTLYEENDQGTTLRIKNKAINSNGGFGTIKDHASFDGYSPFLYLHYVLSCVFSHYGLSFTNPFASGELRKIVLLNNLVDGMSQYTIDYSYLVPDCTALELIKCIEDKFGCRFVVDWSKRIMQCIFLRDIHKSSRQLDWSNKLKNSLTPNFEPTQKLRLDSGTSLDKASPAFADWRQWLKSASDEATDYAVLPVGGEKIYYLKTQGVFGRNKKGVQGVGITNNIDIKSSANFAYASEGTEEEIEITTDDECITMVNARYDDMSTMIRYEEQFPYFPAEEKRKIKAFNAESSETEEESNAECPICFCFAYGKTWKGLGFKPSGSPYNAYTSYSLSGGASYHEGSLSLEWISSRGLYNHYYKEHDSFIRFANKTYVGEFLLTQQDISNLEWNRKVMVKNQPYLIESIEITLTPHGIRTDNVTLKSCRLYSK